MKDFPSAIGVVKGCSSGLKCRIHVLFTLLLLVSPPCFRRRRSTPRPMRSKMFSHICHKPHKKRRLRCAGSTNRQFLTIEAGFASLIEDSYSSSRGIVAVIACVALADGMINSHANGTFIQSEIRLGRHSRCPCLSHPNLMMCRSDWSPRVPDPATPVRPPDDAHIASPPLPHLQQLALLGPTRGLADRRRSSL